MGSFALRAALVVVGVAVAAGCAGPRQEAGPSSGTTASGKLDPTAVDVGLERVRSHMSACVGNARDGVTFNAAITVRGDGMPTEAHVTGDFFDPNVGLCLENAILGARFRAFSGEPVTVSVPGSLP